MKYDVECPFCGAKFLAYEWEDGTCPKCAEKYHWDEQNLPEGDNEWADSWTFVVWENLERTKK